jgi:hypothetical protein
MLFHLGVVLLLTLACVLFGLLRADVKDQDSETSCEGCQDHDSCEHFSIVGFESHRCKVRSADN